MPAKADCLELLKDARKAAKKAAGHLARHGIPKGVFEKADYEIVTAADKESQEMIFDCLERHGLPIVSEEGAEKSGAGKYWVVDPLDGTEHFARGFPLYSVAIALVEKNQPVLGVVNAPALSREYYCALGGGAYKNGKRVRVSRPVTIERASDTSFERSRMRGTKARSSTT